MDPEVITEENIPDLLADDRLRYSPELEGVYAALTGLLASSSKVRMSSSVYAAAEHPAFAALLGIGKPILPLVFRDIRDNRFHQYWFLVLALTGAKPPTGFSGQMHEIRDWYVDWGKKHGYLRPDGSLYDRIKTTSEKFAAVLELLRTEKNEIVRMSIGEFLTVKAPTRGLAKIIGLGDTVQEEDAEYYLRLANGLC
jgi:hypothetical protein